MPLPPLFAIFAQVALTATAATAAATTTSATALPRIEKVEVVADDIFDLEKDDRLLYRAANFFHIQTHEDVIRRELLFKEGDPARAEVLAETERNLRALPYVYEATVREEPLPDGGALVRVHTRDKWTLRFGAGAGVVGGVGRARVDVGDSNLLGFGKEVGMQLIARTDRRIARFSYTDPNIMGTRIRLDLDASFSDLGTFYAADISRAFYERTAPYAFDFGASHEDAEVEFFREGDVIATIEQRVRSVGGEVAVGWGPSASVRRLWLRVELERSEFDPPDGDDPLAVRWPRNRDTLDIALRPAVNAFARFEKLERIDAYGIVEDIPIGASGSIEAGGEWRRDVLGSRIEPLVGARALVTGRPSIGDQVVTGGASFDTRLHENRGEAERALIGAFYHHYVRVDAWQTLAWSLAFDFAREEEDLEIELTLGEDNGLRGYKARLLEGTRRLRWNLEDRIFTPVELYSFHLGFVAFFDAGWVWNEDRRARAGDVRTSVGFGIRVYSPEFLKRVPLRADIAFPLGERGDGPAVSVSLSVGHVFTLFKQEEELAARF